MSDHARALAFSMGGSYGGQGYNPNEQMDGPQQGSPALKPKATAWKNGSTFNPGYNFHRKNSRNDPNKLKRKDRGKEGEIMDAEDKLRELGADPSGKIQELGVGGFKALLSRIAKALASKLPQLASRLRELKNPQKAKSVWDSLSPLEQSYAAQVFSKRQMKPWEIKSVQNAIDKRLRNWQAEGEMTKAEYEAHKAMRFGKQPKTEK